MLMLMNCYLLLYLFTKIAEVNIDACCPVGVPSKLHVFAARVHAHALGVVISGYKYNQKVLSFTTLKLPLKDSSGFPPLTDRRNDRDCQGQSTMAPSIFPD